MPSRPVLTLAQAYTLIVESGNTSDPNVRWRNTWDIHATTQPTPSDPIITDLINFHLYNLRTDAGVFMLTLRNWSQGPQPFATRPFLWEYNVGGTPGLKTGTPPHGYNGEGAGNQSIPGSAVLFAKRQTLSGGKQTSLFLRGLLDDVDVVSETGGKYVYATGGHVTNGAFGAIVDHRCGRYRTVTEQADAQEQALAVFGPDLHPASFLVDGEDCGVYFVPNPPPCITGVKS